MLKKLEKYFDTNLLKEEFRKLGVNFATAGVVGVFINHIAGSRISAMLTVSFWMAITGALFLFAGLYRGK
jgi:hypothetical protein